MVNQKSIDQFSWLYAFYKFCVWKFFRLFYRRVQVVGQENVVLDRPLILAPNHQNALMDALAVLCNIPYQPVFYARSDIFRKPLIIRILTFMKIMPIYRIRDGISNVKRNDEMFDKGLRILENLKSPICIMPEGNHGDKRRLRPIVKGIFRIAFAGQEKYGTNPGVKIVPVGLDWSHYIHFRSDVLIRYGKPIEVSEYYPLYQANPAEGTNALKERLEREMSAIMTDIRPLDDYDTIEHLRPIVRPAIVDKHNTGKSLLGQFAADKRLVDGLNRASANSALPEILVKDLANYQAGLQKLGIRDHTVRRAPYSGVLLLFQAIVGLALLPVHLIGVVANYLPYKLPVWYARRIQDTQFKSSFKFILGIVFLIVWYLFLAVIFANLPLSTHIKWPAFALLPVLGIFSVEYYIHCKKLISRIRFWWMQRFVPASANALLTLRADIVSQTLKIIE